jgi:hypothetical protein
VAQLGGGDSDFELARQPGATEAFGRFAAGEFADNMLAVPDLAATAGLRIATNQPLLGGDAPLPKLGERVLPIPRVGEMAAGARAIPKIFSGSGFKDAFQAGTEEQTAYDASLREAHPIASGAGEITGDIATLFTGRTGLRKGAKAEASTIAAGRSVVPYIEPGLRRQLDEITRSVIGSKLPRGLARAAETGIEGAVLAVLDEGDPIQTAALAAGSQAAGSLFMTMAKPFASGPGLLSAVALSAVGIQLFKEATPGGPDSAIQSLETSIFKVLPIVSLGVVAAAAGFGRISGPMKQNLPKLADAITTIPRGSIVSLLETLSKDEKEGRPESMRVLETFAADPTAFGPGAMLRIQRSLEAGNFSEEVSRLMEIPEVRQLVEGGEPGLPQSPADAFTASPN